MTDPDSEAIETFLRGVAERELRHWRRSGGIGPPFPPLDKVRDAIGTLTRAEIADDDALWPILEDLDIALWLRSDTPMNNTGHFIRRMVQSRTMSALPPPPMVRRGPPRPEPLVVPLGRRIRVEDERAPCDLYLMTYLRTEHDALISTVIRMRWPADGSSADLEFQGAGPQHLPYARLALTDERGTRYRVVFHGDGAPPTGPASRPSNRLRPPGPGGRA
ncbi:MAG TPA: hypothetical protein VGG16_03160 [Streptosporangiaceae bacterium]